MEKNDKCPPVHFLIKYFGDISMNFEERHIIYFQIVISRDYLSLKKNRIWTSYALYPKKEFFPIKKFQSATPPFLVTIPLNFKISSFRYNSITVVNNKNIIIKMNFSNFNLAFQFTVAIFLMLSSEAPRLARPISCEKSAKSGSANNGTCPISS